MAEFLHLKAQLPWGTPANRTFIDVHGGSIAPVSTGKCVQSHCREHNTNKFFFGTAFL